MSLATSKSIFCVTLSAILVALCFSAEAQQPKKVPRVGFLTAAGPGGPYIEAFRGALRDLRYIEGKNILVEYRYAEGKIDRLPDLAIDLVNLKLDLIVVASSQAANAAKQATTIIPIVMATGGDPVETGLIKSLAQPGGNITGMTVYSPEVTGKRLELLKEAFPKISRVAVLGDPTSTGYQLDWATLKTAGKSLAVQLQSLTVHSPNPDFKGAFVAATKDRAEAFLTLPPPLLAIYRKEIVVLVAESKLPAIYHNRDFIDVGGLMSYGPNLADSFKRAATYVDKILNGAKPAELPVEQPKKFELVINLKTAKQIGLTVPQRVLLKADRVIK